MKKHWRITSVLVFLAAVLIGGLYGQRTSALNDETKESLRLYTELLSVAHENYGDEVTYKDLVHASIQGMTRLLDPHTNFLPPEDYSGMRERQRSSFYGLGILVGTRNGRITVITPLEGGPAARLGIRTGDVIDTIDGESTDGLTVDDAVDKLKGPKGSVVGITVLRRGAEAPLEYDVVRAEVPLTTVRYAYMIDDTTGYIYISDFNRGTSREVGEALEKLQEKGMTQLLLDLRNNGGGLLDQAILVGDMFAPRGSKIVETRGRNRNSFQTFFAEGQRKELDMPVVVLVNNGTASAAEILAGAIQDHDIGIVAGTPTWGKGLVQTVFSLSYGAGFALTTARYYTPAGRMIQRDFSSYYDYYAYSTPLEELEANGGIEQPTEGVVESFETDLGRKVYGGGGITPDVVAGPDHLNGFQVKLRSRNSFFDFSVDYTSRNAILNESWEPSEEVLAEFQQWLVRENIASQEEIDEGFTLPETLDYVRLNLRAEVFNSRFGQEAWHRALASGDKVIQAGLDQFVPAQELLQARRELKSSREDQRASLGSADGL
ncbi:MAG: S41 family peptidase [Acidobacteriota bacterium]